MPQKHKAAIPDRRGEGFFAMASGLPRHTEVCGLLAANSELPRRRQATQERQGLAFPMREIGEGVRPAGWARSARHYLFPDAQPRSANDGRAEKAKFGFVALPQSRCPAQVPGNPRSIVALVRRHSSVFAHDNFAKICLDEGELNCKTLFGRHEARGAIHADASFEQALAVPLES